MQQQFKLNNKNIIYFNRVNLSRNAIEDKGAIALGNVLKELKTSQTSQLACQQLSYLALSKCSINTKGINSLSVSLKDYTSSLNVLDLSFNNLKDDPTVIIDIDLFLNLLK